MFSSRVFRDTFVSRHGSVVILRGSHRKESTSWYIAFLDRIRTGEVTEEDIVRLNATSDGVYDEEWAKHTQLRAVHREVHAFNSLPLSLLRGDVFTYSSKDEINAAITHPRRVLYAARRLQDAAPVSVAVQPGDFILLSRAVGSIASGS